MIIVTGEKVERIGFVNTENFIFLGLDEEYMSERDQQVFIARVTRETLLGLRQDRFLVSATCVGLAERQMADGKPR